MTLDLTVSERLARARGDLRMGVPVLVGSVLVIAAEALTAARLLDFRKLGTPVVAVTARRAETLKARCYDGDVARIAVAPDVSVGWVRALADPADDLRVPMKGPLNAVRSGDAAAVRAAIVLAKEARLLPAVLAVEVPEGFDGGGLTRVAVDEVGQVRGELRSVVSANVPLSVSQAGRLHVFRPDDGGEEHYAVEIGRPDRAGAVLTRLHSACFTGDLLGSLKCDCGPQLKAALAQMGAEGAGVLLYLNQEGRGIGLANKMRAYSLQDQGFDTVEANHRLGFEDDERDFEVGAQILAAMGFDAVRLLTNNPAKVAMMAANGIDVVERVPLKVGENPLNAAYLQVKADKSGHLL